MIKLSTLLIGVLVVVAMVVITSVIMAIAPYIAGLFIIVVLFKCYFQRPPTQ